MIPISKITQTPQCARIAAIVLAAGRSRRMGRQNKLCCTLDDVPLIRHTLTAALESDCLQTIVVTGYDAAAVETALHDCSVSLVHNIEFDEGMASSLRCGLRALPDDLDGALILLGDMPRLTAEHINPLLDRFDPAAPAIIAPERNGRRGNPVLWPRRYFDELLALQGDQGARALLKQYSANVMLVTIDDDAIFTDVDTPEELASISGQTTSGVCR